MKSAYDVREPDEAYDWRVDAACATTAPDLFFVEKGQSPRPALKVCADCPVQMACLQWALDHDIRIGIWGKTTPSERRRLTRERRRAA